MIKYGRLLLLLVIGLAAVNAATQGISPRGLCPEHFVEVGGRCLHIDLNLKGTWPNVRAFCQAMTADLVVLSDPQFYSDVIHHIKMTGMDTIDFWVGASDIAVEGHFQWIDGSPVTVGAPFWGYKYVSGKYVLVPDGGTSHDCMFLNHIYFHHFDDYTCGTLKNPICQYNITQPVY